MGTGADTPWTPIAAAPADAVALPPLVTPPTAC